MTFSAQFQHYYTAFEEVLGGYMEQMNFEPPVLAESMRYSLDAGGKRVRPALFYAALDCLGCDYTKESGLAVALECIHTYSLIHDDLPAMDNDDIRRGRPSNHKLFGEANAILAGDALLSYAFDLMLKESGRDARHLQAAQALSYAAGAQGMVAGQSADLLYTGSNGDERELNFIYEHKTARLISAPLIMAATIAGKYLDAFREFGLRLGVLFQLVDDILDVKGGDALGKTPGKDKMEDKLTGVKVYGLSGAEKRADEIAAACKLSLRAIGADTAFFAGMVDLCRNRNK